MSTNDPLKNWQLENKGESLEQWKLQDSEQDLSKHLRLEEGAQTPSQWQPVEYRREPAKPRRNWLLPSVVIVALLAVLIYVVWVAFGRMGDTFDLTALTSLIPGAAGPTVTAPTPVEIPSEAPAAVVLPAETDTPTPEPTLTLAPTATATPVPEPTIGLVPLVRGTVNTVTGVNARSEPSVEGAILKLLAENEQVIVVDEADDLARVIFDGTTIGYVASEFLDRTTEQVPLEDYNGALVGAGLAPITPEPPALDPGSLLMPTPTPVPPALEVTITANPGTNVRQTASLEGIVLQALPTGTAVEAIGRTVDGDWLLIQLDDAQLGWVLAEFVSAIGDLTTLDVVDPASLPVPGADVAAPGAAAGAPVLETNGVTPAEPFTNTLPAVGAALAISDTAGVNVRAEPTTESGVLLLAPNGAVLSVIGRLADSSWLQVRLPDDTVGWMFADAIVGSDNVDAAPVVGGEGEAATEPTVAEETPAPPPAPAAVLAVATVTNPFGSNVRPSPEQNADPINTAAIGDVLDVIGRNQAGDWLQVQLEDGTQGWILAATATVDSDVAALPVTE